MEKTERLLDLVALLLDAEQPIPWAQFRTLFPDDYGVGAGNSEAGERKFARDKAELLELGLPLTWVAESEDDPAGYLLDKSSYYLPDVGLTAEEQAVLYTAGSAALASGAFPASQDLAHALRKLSFERGPNQAPPRVRVDLGEGEDPSRLSETLDTLWSAAQSRKRVELDYRSPRRAELTHRAVDPWGLAMRRGLWSLVGYCHLRKEVRTFHVHRIAQVVPPKPGKAADFEVPKDFRLEDYVASWPWQHRFHPPENVTVRLAGALSPLGERLFPGNPLRTEGEVTRCDLSVTDLDGLIRYLLSLGPGASIESPVSAVEKLRAVLTQIAGAHA